MVNVRLLINTSFPIDSYGTIGRLAMHEDNQELQDKLQNVGTTTPFVLSFLNLHIFLLKFPTRK